MERERKEGGTAGGKKRLGVEHQFGRELNRIDLKYTGD